MSNYANYHFITNPSASANEIGAICFSLYWSLIQFREFAVQHHFSKASLSEYLSCFLTSHPYVTTRIINTSTILFLVAVKMSLSFQMIVRPVVAVITLTHQQYLYEILRAQALLHVNKVGTIFFFRYNLFTQSLSTTYMLCACVSRTIFTYLSRVLKG